MKRVTSIIAFSAIMIVLFLFIIAVDTVATASGWSPEIRLTEDDADSQGPDLAVDGENLHLVWRDDRNGNYEVYY